MGLNLSIKRIVFSTIQKFDGRTNRFLHPAVRNPTVGLNSFIIETLYRSCRRYPISNVLIIIIVIIINIIMAIRR
jgi:hypothetical protein